MTEPGKNETRTRDTAATGTAADPARPRAREKPREKRQRPRHGHAAWAVSGFLLVLLAFGGAWIAWPLWNQSLPGWLRYALAPVMEAGRYPGLIARVETVEKKVAAMAADVAALGDRMAKRGAVDPARLDALAGKVQALEDKAASGADATASRLGELDDRLRTVEAATGALAERPPVGGGADAAALARLQARMQAQIEAVKTETGAALQKLDRDNRTLAEALARAEARLTAAETRGGTVASASRDSAFLLAVGQLRDATRGSAPFAAALRAVRALIGDEKDAAPALETLAMHAATGVPDVAALRARLAAVAPAIARAPADGEGGGWWDQTLDRLSGLISVRRVGPRAATRDDAEGRVARAEMALAAGDVAGAVGALDALAGPAAGAAAPWLAAAKTRLAVDGAVAAIDAVAIRRMGGAPRG